MKSSLTAKASHGVLGFSGTEFASNAGIVVNRVFPGGPAEQGGLRPDDIIMSIDGKAVESVNKTLDLVSQSQPGTVLTLEVVRAGEPLTLQVTVGELGFG